jgi:hypothetical protein
MIEAVVIGIMNLVLFELLKHSNIKISHNLMLVLCGALIHIIFEYTGGNKWWCTTTYKS